jgi:hypothetical protein
MENLVVGQNLTVVARKPPIAIHLLIGQGRELGDAGMSGIERG